MEHSLLPVRSYMRKSINFHICPYGAAVRRWLAHPEPVPPPSLRLCHLYKNLKCENGKLQFYGGLCARVFLCLCSFFMLH